MKILHLVIIAGFGLFLMLPSVAYAQTQQNYSHGIGSNSSALYNSIGLTYQQCQNKISDGLQKVVDSLDRGKAVAIALASPDFQAKVAGHTYELTDISTNDTWDNSLCDNVKRTAVGVSFNLLDTPNTYFESVNVAEDANMSKVTEVGTETTPICSNNCPPAIPAGWSNFVPDISSDFHFNGVMIPNGTVPVSVDLANAGNSTLYNVHIAFVDSPLLQNFKTSYGNFTLQVGQEKTILGTMYTPSEISNVSSSLNWMVYANNQGNTTGSKEFSKTVNLAVKSASRDGSISYSTILPPLKQDIPVSDVQCKQGLELVIKSDDYSPACVTPSTNQTLVERGWGESLDSLKESPLVKKMEIDGLQQNYGIGQPINATVRYTGWSFNDYPDVKILDANGSQVWFNCPECVVRTELAGIPYPGIFDTYDYPVRDPNGNPPMVNKTGTYTMVTSLDNKTASAKFDVIPVPSIQQNNTGIVNIGNQTNQMTEFDGVIVDQSLDARHFYSLYTNDTSEKFNIGSNGISLDGLNNIDGLDGKYVRIFGALVQVPNSEDEIKVDKFQITGSLVPKANPTRNMSQQITLEELYSNPDKYYNQTVTITGQLREYDNPIAYAGVGCSLAQFTTSDIFVPDFVSRHQLYDGQNYIGVRIGGADDVGYSPTERLPADLKNKSVSVTGIFVPEIHDTGMCMHVLHKSGYLLTDFSKIVSIGG